MGGGRIEKCLRWTLELDPDSNADFVFLISCVTFDYLNLSFISVGEGNGNPFQHSCLENPMDRGAWRAAVLGVAESDTAEAT